MAGKGPNLRSTAFLTASMRGVMFGPITGDCGWNFASSRATVRLWCSSAVIIRRRLVSLAAAACSALSLATVSPWSARCLAARCLARYVMIADLSRICPLWPLNSAASAWFVPPLT